MNMSAEFLYFWLYFFFFHFEPIDINGSQFALWFRSNLSCLFFSPLLSLNEFKTESVLAAINSFCFPLFFPECLLQTLIFWQRGNPSHLDISPGITASPSCGNAFISEYLFQLIQLSGKPWWSEKATFSLHMKQSHPVTHAFWVSLLSLCGCIHGNTVNSASMSDGLHASSCRLWGRKESTRT